MKRDISKLIEFWRFETLPSESVLSDKCEYIKWILSEKLTSNSSDEIDATVVIPAYKEEKYILSCLLALSKQITSYKVDFLIISNWESHWNLTQQLCEACWFNVIHESIWRVSLARQIWLNQAKGKYTISTDADSVFWENRVNELLKSAIKHKTEFSYGKYEFISKKILPKLIHESYMYIRKSMYWLNPISETNNIFLTNRALEVWWYDTSLVYWEWISLRSKLDQNFNFIQEKWTKIYTSWRRIDNSFWKEVKRYFKRRIWIFNPRENEEYKPIR